VLLSGVRPYGRFIPGEHPWRLLATIRHAGTPSPISVMLSGRAMPLTLFSPGASPGLLRGPKPRKWNLQAAATSREFLLTSSIAIWERQYKWFFGALVATSGKSTRARLVLVLPAGCPVWARFFFLAPAAPLQALCRMRDQGLYLRQHATPHRCVNGTLQARCLRSM